MRFTQVIAFLLPLAAILAAPSPAKGLEHVTRNVTEKVKENHLVPRLLFGPWSQKENLKAWARAREWERKRKLRKNRNRNRNDTAGTPKHMNQARWHKIKESPRIKNLTRFKNLTRELHVPPPDVGLRVPAITRAPVAKASDRPKVVMLSISKVTFTRPFVKPNATAAATATATAPVGAAAPTQITETGVRRMIRHGCGKVRNIRLRPECAQDDEIYRRTEGSGSAENPSSSSLTNTELSHINTLLRCPPPNRAKHLPDCPQEGETAEQHRERTKKGTKTVYKSIRKLLGTIPINAGLILPEEWFLESRRKAFEAVEKRKAEEERRAGRKTTPTNRPKPSQTKQA